MTKFNHKLFFSFLTFLGSVHSIHAFKHTFYNATPFEVVFKNGYMSAACADDTLTIQPGESKTMKVAGCILKYSRCDVIVPRELAGTVTTTGRDAKAKIQAIGYETNFTGNGSFVVVGPITETVKDVSNLEIPKDQYRVTRWIS